MKAAEKLQIINVLIIVIVFHSRFYGSHYIPWVFQQAQLSQISQSQFNSKCK